MWISWTESAKEEIREKRKMRGENDENRKNQGERAGFSQETR